MSTLDLSQAADLLKVSPVTLRKRAAAGTVPGYKPGKAWVFLEDEIMGYLRSKRPCPSIDIRSLRTGGVASSSTDGNSDSQLAQRLAAKRRNLKRSRETEPTRKSASVIALPIRGRKPENDG